MLLKFWDNIGYFKGRKVCVQEEGGVDIDLSNWVTWKSIYFSVPREWALQLVIHDCLMHSTFVSLVEQRAILFWSRKLLCIGCSVKQGIMVSFQWFNDAMMATFTGETVSDVPVYSFIEVAFSTLLWCSVVQCQSWFWISFYYILWRSKQRQFHFNDVQLMLSLVQQQLGSPEYSDLAWCDWTKERN